MTSPDAEQDFAVAANFRQMAHESAQADLRELEQRQVQSRSYLKRAAVEKRLVEEYPPPQEWFDETNR